MKTVKRTLAIAGLMLACVFVSCNKEELESTKADLTEARADLSRARTELNTLESQLNNAQNALSNTQNDLSNANVKIDGLEATLESTELLLEEANAMIDSLEIELNDANVAIESWTEGYYIMVDKYHDQLRRNLNPWFAQDWFVERYPLVAMNPGNLELHRIAWVRDAAEVGYKSDLATSLGLDLKEFSKLFRGEYGSRVDPRFDGDQENKEVGGYAYIGALEDLIGDWQHGVTTTWNGFTVAYNNPYGSWYTHPDNNIVGTYDEPSSRLHWFLRHSYHEMGHAYFNYKHPTDGEGNVIQGFDGHLDIMGYDSTTTDEDEWLAMVERYFDASTQDQITGYLHAKNPEERIMECQEYHEH